MNHVSQHEHPLAPQPDSPLKQAIIRLCEEGRHYGSSDEEHACSSETEIWIAIQNAIEETVLPRELTLYVDGTAVLQLTIARRHLNSVRSLSNLGRSSVDTAISTADFAHCIRKTCQFAQSYRLVTKSHGTLPSEPPTGCSGQQLMDALTCGLERRQSEDPLGALKSMARAIIVVDAEGNEQDAAGSEDLLQTLRRVSACQGKTKRNPQAQHLKPDRFPHRSCLLVPFRPDQKIVAAEIANVHALLIASDKQVSSSSFRALFEPQGVSK